ncbi:IS21 family transposase [Streptomyces olivaceus]|uniref:IS21 family transposase n=1 Tax=Streptomyces olivaceus TaxID=47716 RepID=UPI001D1732E9|nr:IS21 family transposase [Streptomyces olivaceus]
MVLDPQRWLELRRFRGLVESGAMSLTEVAKETGLNWRTVSKYLSADGPASPPRRSPSGRSRARVIDEFAPLVDSMLRAEILMKAAVIHERLAAEYGFTGNYQRTKLYVQGARPRIAAELGITPKELAGMHRRFEVIPGAQAQVDWGDEGKILAHMGIAKVYSFHMTLSYSRDLFCCFTTSQDLQTFFDCHRRAFAHFGGVPMTIVYDRTKTVVRRHVAPGEAVPLHPEAVGFAGHYDFDVLAAYRPTGKGRVERQVLIVRDHVLSGRSFSSVEEMDAAFAAWVPQRRAQIHKTHREVIGERAARDHAALKPLPPTPYLVAELDGDDSGDVGGQRVRRGLDMAARPRPLRPASPADPNRGEGARHPGDRAGQTPGTDAAGGPRAAGRAAGPRPGLPPVGAGRRQSATVRPRRGRSGLGPLR